jgi:Predicted integral membrane protein
MEEIRARQTGDPIGTAQGPARPGQGRRAAEIDARDGSEPQTAIGARLTSCCPQLLRPVQPRGAPATQESHIGKRGFDLGHCSHCMWDVAVSTLAAIHSEERSIAVLPFENLSSDKENAYFAEGIQDEILTRLSKIGDLKVISRTSTQHYQSAPKNLREIAKQLGVAHILEGSVQKSADTVRVNVQLIKAASDSHLWSDTFDRKLTDILSVESEVAKTIADQLRAKTDRS